MKRWGIVVTLFYALVLSVLLLPAVVWLASEQPSFRRSLDWYEISFSWIWLATLAGAQGLLLFLSVDTSWKKRKPRQHIAITAILAGFLTGVLTFSAVVSLVLAIKSPLYDGGGAKVLAWMIGVWMMWGILFHLYARGSPKPVALLTSWLLRASILELLIAIPAHIIVRQRDECTTPAFTGYGVVTGFAIMFLGFGPSVLALFKKRLDAYSQRSTGAINTNDS